MKQHRNNVPESHGEARAIIHRGGGGTVAICNNTVLRDAGTGAQPRVAMVLHGTAVATYCGPVDSFAPGGVILNTGGWQTVTTKDRINRALGGRGRVFSDARVWYFAPRFDFASRVEFVDGMGVDIAGTVTMPGELSTFGGAE